MHLTTRQLFYGDDGGSGSWWYYSETAFIIKWVITGAIVVGLLLFFVIGYLHAQHRMKKGLPPLRYHKYLIPRKQRERYWPATPGSYYYRGPPGHGPAVPLNQYNPPPPAYGENDYVPPYSPPEGASKVDPNQNQGFNHTNLGGPSGPSRPPPAAGQYH